MFINNNNSILYENQFGFQKGKSTHFAIILLTDKITEALDRSECLIGVFLDFSKAFDTIDHDILFKDFKDSRNFIHSKKHTSDNRVQ